MSAAPPNNQTSRMEFYAVDNYVKAHRDCSYIIVHDSDKRGQEGPQNLPPRWSAGGKGVL